MTLFEDLMENATKKMTVIRKAQYIRTIRAREEIGNGKQKTL